MHIREYITLLQNSEVQLAGALADLADYHCTEPEICAVGRQLASWSRQHVTALAPFGADYLLREGLAEKAPPQGVARQPRPGSYGLLYDLQAAWLLAQDVYLRWTVLGQVARALRDRQLATLCAELGNQTDRQLAWLRTRIVMSAPQALITDP